MHKIDDLQPIDQPPHDAYKIVPRTLNSRSWPGFTICTLPYACD